LSSPTAELLEDHLLVWDATEARKLYAEGFYGKPVGVSKPKQDEFEAPLVLDPLEGLFLLEKKRIVVKDSNGRDLSAKMFQRQIGKLNKRFELDYLVYRDLREKGKVVLSGIKFGCDFAVYDNGPGIDHAPFLVSVMKPDDWVSSTDIVRAGRLATTVRKRFILAAPNKNSGRIRYLMFDWFRA
jgi:tRNA-intron endonuclease